MKITLEMYNHKYTVESDHDDYTAEEVQTMFNRLLVSAGYPATVIKEDL